MLDLRNYTDTMQMFQMEIESLKEQNKRYRERLEIMHKLLEEVVGDVSGWMKARGYKVD